MNLTSKARQRVSVVVDNHSTSGVADRLSVTPQTTKLLSANGIAGEENSSPAGRPNRARHSCRHQQKRRSQAHSRNFLGCT
jgi:hypothetical protein